MRRSSYIAAQLTGLKCDECHRYSNSGFGGMNVRISDSCVGSIHAGAVPDDFGCGRGGKPMQAKLAHTCYYAAITCLGSL
jgi:hypothetical protein